MNGVEHDLLWYTIGLAFFFGTMGSLLTLFFVSKHIKKTLQSFQGEEISE